MNWAELHEISVTLKATHKDVGYRRGTKEEHCGNCANFIPAEPPRCRTVECPIERPMWCERYNPI